MNNKNELLLLPIDYIIEKDLINLIATANLKYGEYKSLIQSSSFDSKLFLNSLLIHESLKSTQIEGTQISQDEMFYLKYYPKNDEVNEINNLKEVYDFACLHLSEGKKLTLDFMNDCHRILLRNTRGSEKEPGKVRSLQNWIGVSGSTIQNATYIPPKPEDLNFLLNNLLDYMNDSYIDPFLVNVAISHYQFESIHPYRDGNGRIGRALISVQTAYLNEMQPILFLSEVIELYKPTYYRVLNEARKKNITIFIKFFMECIIEQCTSFIYKINRIKKIYEKDLIKLDSVKGSICYKIFPIAMQMVVFTKSEIALAAGVSRNAASSVVEQLVTLKILEKDVNSNKKIYKYSEIMNVFEGK